jgi:hypothetical protein
MAKEDVGQKCYCLSKKKYKFTLEGAFELLHVLSKKKKYELTPDVFVCVHANM